MFDVMPVRLREMIFRSVAYDWLLPSRAPSSVGAPQGLNGLGAEAAWGADMLAPPHGIAPAHGRDDFRNIAAAGSAPADIWPAVATWISANRRWHPETWRADILAERLTRWLSVYNRVSVGIDPAERTVWASEILRTAKHLGRAGTNDMAPWRRFLVHQGRINATLALPELEGKLQKNLTALGADVDTQVLSDGGHIERSPPRALCVLAILTEIRDALLGHYIEPPSELISAIDRMVPFLKAVLHTDGGFALIGGATATTAPLIDAVIAASGSKGRAMSSAPRAGCHRLRAGQITLIADCGRTHVSTDTALKDAFKAPGSFEMSAGKNRLIGNCGMRLADDPGRDKWSRALRSTAAHTALVVNDRDAGTVNEAEVARRDHEGARLIEMRHDGYVASTGIHHTRTIYLDASGSDVRGEDALTGARAQPFSVRFHLYPEIRASMVTGGGEIILKPPRGRGWRFTCRYPVRLEDGISFFDGRQHRTQQIVILGNHEPAETIVKWRFAIDD